MKKLSLSLLFIFALVLSSCQGVNQSEPELVLSYYCDSNVQDTCYKDLKTEQGEISISTEGYNFINWYSPDKVLLNEYDISHDQSSDEYYFFDTKTKSMECITCSLKNLSDKSLSPSLRKVAMYRDNDLKIVDLDQPDKVVASSSGFESISQLDWAPDESFVIFVDGNTRLYRFDLKDGSLLQLFNEPSALQVFYPSLNPAGDLLVFYVVDGNNHFYLSIMSADGTDYRVLVDLTPKTTTVLGSEDSGTNFTWSPTGDRLAYVIFLENESGRLYQDGIYIVDLKGGEPLLIDASPTSKWSLTWSPDGSMLAFAANAEGQSPDIWTIAPDGSNLVNQTNTPGRSEFGPGWKR